MEPGDRPAQELNDRPDDHRARTVLRVAAGCILLVGIAFIQSPGFLIADTKFDLAVDPIGFLSRAVHLWDDEGAFGQLQNQAYGYLWPMGPFFAIGALLDLPGWVVQRLWLALVMCVSFVGTARLSRALGVRSDVACLVAAFAYATSPRMLTTLGPISIEAWPSALAPWVLLPLVRGATAGSPRRMALLAGLAVAMVGGVNAAATFAVIPLGVIWLLTRQPGPRRRGLMLWWPVFTAAGTLWWLVPLFVMGAYSPPFLDFIETASVTTFPTTLFDALRGTSAWVPYVDSSWQGGSEAITRFYLPLNSGIVLMLGLVGLLLPRNPHRQFLLLSVVTGLFLVTMGHLGAVEGWFADPLYRLLDGVLAPFRNLHKFDPVIRLPMVLGMAWLIEAAIAARRTTSIDLGGRTLRFATYHQVVGLALLGVVGASIPATAARLAPTDPVLDTPQYWSEAADWLSEHSGDSVALLAPGSSFGEYVWGSPHDEPIQYIADSRWAVRNAIPLTPPGNIRMLDAFEARMSQGLGSRGLAGFLRRAGVKYVVVRNDLERTSDVPDPVLVHQALAASPGISLAETFGPDIGGGASLETRRGRALVSGGWQDQYPVIEVFEVNRVDDAVTAEALPVVVGGPEDLLGLSDAGLVGSEPTLLAVDADPDEQPRGPVLLTDGMLDRERFFGRVHDGASSVTTPGDVRRSGNPTKDYALGSGDRWRTTARLVDARSISASSSQSDANAVGGARPGRLPYAAVDGLEDTEWVSGSGEDEWWQLDLDLPRPLQTVTITAGQHGSSVQHLRVETSSGESEVLELGPGESVTVRLGGSTVDWLRVENALGTPGRLALAAVDVPGLEVRRPLALPEVPAAWGSPDHILLRTLLDARSGCVVIDGRVPCVEGREMNPEEPNGLDRVVNLPEPATYDATLTARPRSGPAVANLIQRNQPLNATGSSTAVPDMRTSGIAAIDGDPGTTWTPLLTDARPQLALNWIGGREVSRIKAKVARSAPAQQPTELLLLWPGGERRVQLDRRGRAEFPSIRTDRLVVRVVTADGTVSIEQDGFGARLPVGISTLRLDGVPFEPLELSTDRRPWACGTGPTVEVNGAERQTRLVASPAELYAGTTVPTVPCGSGEATGEVTLTSGENTVRAMSSEVAVAETLLLGAGAAAADGSAADLDGFGPDTQQVTPEPGSEVLALRQNYNAGWTATQSGSELEPVVVDGWQQGWLTDGSDEPVVTRFGPDTAYRWGLGVGAALLLLLVALAFVPGRRWPGAGAPSIGGRELPAVVLLPGAVLMSGVLAGWVGAAVGAGGVLLGVLLGRRLGDAGAWLVSVPLLAAGFGYFLRPWADADGWAGTWSWPGYLVVVALAAGLATVAPGRHFLSRIDGFSMRR